jgi:hypothetical protein
MSTWLITILSELRLLEGRPWLSKSSCRGNRLLLKAGRPVCCTLCYYIGEMKLKAVLRDELSSAGPLAILVLTAVWLMQFIVFRPLWLIGCISKPQAAVCGKQPWLRQLPIKLMRQDEMEQMSVIAVQCSRISDVSTCCPSEIKFISFTFPTA